MNTEEIKGLIEKKNYKALRGLIEGDPFMKIYVDAAISYTEFCTDPKMADLLEQKAKLALELSSLQSTVRELEVRKKMLDSVMEQQSQSVAVARLKSNVAEILHNEKASTTKEEKSGAVKPANKKVMFIMDKGEYKAFSEYELPAEQANAYIEEGAAVEGKSR